MSLEKNKIIQSLINVETDRIRIKYNNPILFYDIEGDIYPSDWNVLKLSLNTKTNDNIVNLWDQTFFIQKNKVIHKSGNKFSKNMAKIIRSFEVIAESQLLELKLGILKL